MWKVDAEKKTRVNQRKTNSNGASIAQKINTSLTCVSLEELKLSFVLLFVNGQMMPRLF